MDSKPLCSSGHQVASEGWCFEDSNGEELNHHPNWKGADDPGDAHRVQWSRVYRGVCDCGYQLTREEKEALGLPLNWPHPV
jgi:hypothetical protein